MILELRSLRVINCGPLKDVCIHFASGERGITLLAGANGSGKTTVLELVASLAEMLVPSNYLEDHHFLDRAEYAQLDCTLDNFPASIFCGQVSQETMLAPDYYGKDRASLRLGQGTYDVGSNLSFYQLGEAINKQQENTLAFNSLRDRADAKGDLLPSILYFPHTRFLTPVEGERLYREETNYQWVYRFENIREFEGSLASYLIWLEYAYPETFEEVATMFRADLDGKTFEINRKQLQALVRTRDGQTHDVAQLSSGEQNLVIMLIELRRRLLPHSIVLIDEIENSLHPAFQYRLANALKRLQEQIPFQLIITTHARAFVEIFGPESLRILTDF